jgi:hypothetical protein
MISNDQNQEVAEFEAVTYNTTQNDAESLSAETAIVSNEVQYELLKANQREDLALQKYVY